MDQSPSLSLFQNEVYESASINLFFGQEESEALFSAAADYLRRLDPDEIRSGVAFLSGRPFPLSDPRTLDIGPGAFSHAADVPETETSVLPPLTIQDVAASFGQIAQASGKGSREQKYARLRELVEMASAHERPILFRLLHNELRIGLHDGLIQEAIARASGGELKTVRHAALFSRISRKWHR
ncbi:MAG TPA: hypothetical protein VGB09_02325 [Candidatus Binatia bacterium]